MKKCQKSANLRRSAHLVSKDGKFISFYGDNHPVYAGNVVKAMASAKNGYPYIVKLFEQELASLNPSQQAERDAAAKNLFARLDAAFKATIVEINRLTPTIVKLRLLLKNLKQVNFTVCKITKPLRRRLKAQF
jgi:hypothetical protein